MRLVPSLVVIGTLFLASVTLSLARERAESSAVDGLLLQARLSPRGDAMALTMLSWAGPQREPFLQLLVASSSGKRPTALTAPPRQAWDPVFRGTSNTLLFLSDRLGAPQLFQIDMGGGEASPVTSLPAGLHSFLLSPSGQHLALIAYSQPQPPSGKSDLWSPLPRDSGLGGNAEVLLVGRCPKDQWCKPRPTGVHVTVEPAGFRPGPARIPAAFVLLNGEERLVACRTDANGGSALVLVPSKKSGAPLTIARLTFFAQAVTSAGTSKILVSGATGDGAGRLTLIDLEKGESPLVPQPLQPPPGVAGDGLPIVLRNPGGPQQSWVGAGGQAWLHHEGWQALPTPSDAFLLLDVWACANGEALLLTLAHKDGSTSVQRLRILRPVSQRLVDGGLPAWWWHQLKRNGARTGTATQAGLPWQGSVYLGYSQEALFAALMTAQLLDSLGAQVTLVKSSLWWRRAEDPSTTVPPGLNWMVWMGQVGPPHNPKSRQAPPSSSCRTLWATWSAAAGEETPTKWCPRDLDVCLHANSDSPGIPTVSALRTLVQLLTSPHPELQGADAQ